MMTIVQSGSAEMPTAIFHELVSPGYVLALLK